MDAASRGNFVAVARVADLADGTSRQIRVQGRAIALFQMEGKFLAIDGICPHKGAPLGEGSISGTSVHCPLHGWQFDVETGACMDRPDKPVQTFPVRIVNGEIQIQLSTEPPPGRECA